MEKTSAEHWDARYSQEEFVFGTKPNDFLVSVADKIRKNAKVLSLCEGEGRNGTFLAGKGCQVVSVDGSTVGLAKAKKLAESLKVELETIVTDLQDYKIKSRQWDAIVLFFGHFSPDLRQQILTSIPKGLKKNGVFIMEAFSPEQLNYNTGGPSDVMRLYELAEVKKYLNGLEFEIARETIREADEGGPHQGKSAVVQILARKK